MTEYVVGLGVARGHGALGGGLRQALGWCALSLVAVESALNRVFGGHGQRLWIMEVLDLVRLVVTDIRAVVKSRGSGKGPRNDAEQRPLESLVIVGELLRELAGGGV